MPYIDASNLHKTFNTPTYTLHGIEGLLLPPKAEWLRVLSDGTMEFNVDQRWFTLSEMGEYWQVIAASYAATFWEIEAEDQCIGCALLKSDIHGCRRCDNGFFKDCKSQAAKWREVAKEAGER